MSPPEAGAAGRRAPPTVLVVFGASGDLTARKILPGLERLSRRGLLPEEMAVVGVARSDLGDEGFRSLALEAVPDHGPSWEDLVSRFFWVRGGYGEPDTFAALAKVLDRLDEDLGTLGNRIFYLASVPEVFAGITRCLGESGLSRPAREGARVALVVEKPFGSDLSSARSLDATVHRSFQEDQVFRIDHYLAKETVQNVLALRFANAIFEPVWNRRYVDNIQVSVTESLGVEHRGGFYETAGALRDIVQNHVLQVLALTLMEPPACVEGQSVRDEKVKLLRAVVIPSPDAVAGEVVRAQYDAGVIDGSVVQGYRDEDAVSSSSTTETFVALRLQVDNWRWAGVPVYVRTGKRLARRATEVVMEFHRVPHLPFVGALSEELEANTLVLRIQPDEGITLGFGAKVPGQELRVRSVSMDFSYGSAFSEEPPEAYERLLLDAMTGDPTLFIRSDEVERAWEIVEPVLACWERGQPPLQPYPAGSWGPEGAELLLAREGRSWHTP